MSSPPGGWDGAEHARFEGLRSDICMTEGCGHPGDVHEWGSCNECRCYVYDPYPALRVLKGGGMADGTTAEVMFISGEYWPTRNGKQRWKLRSNDGREFGVWDQAVYDGVMQHLQQPLQCEVGSKQDDRGNWWNTLYAVPALGLQAAGKSDGAKGGTADMTPLVEPLNRIANALENLLSFQVEQRLRQGQDAPPADGPVDDGPQEP